MKYLIVLTDGAGDEPMETLGGKTVLEAAEMPFTDSLAKKGEVGMVDTVPAGMSPGSDVANLSVMGYDPAVYHTGRSPLEAVSMGIDMLPTDVAFRTNIVTLEGDGPYDELIIKDHSSGDISTEEGAEIIKAVNEAFKTDRIEFFPGISYRHAMIVHDGSEDCELIPPHDVLTQKAGPNMPKGKDSAYIADMMRKSYEILKDHPVNKARIEKGLNPANSIWIWGQGRKPALSNLYEKYGVHGTAISAVDLIKGIALCAGMDAVDVPGATGTKHTNFEGKAEAAIKAFSEGKDFVYIHIEAPDECSHQGDLEGKLGSLKDIDEKIVKTVTEYLASTGEGFRVMVVPDHPTPLRIRTHSRGAVPFVIYDSTSEKDAPENEYNEKSGAKGLYFEEGCLLTDHFFKGAI